MNRTCFHRNRAPPIKSSQQTTWHSLTREDAAHKLEVAPASGLGLDEAARRLTLYGCNEIATKGQRGLWRMIVSQFSDFMILVLIAAAIISGYIGEPTDTIVILIIVLLNAVIGFVQDYRAEKALEALRKMSASQARVRRGGEIMNIPAAKLVPGDIVLVESGNILPADLRLLESVQLQVNEAPLTGESQPIDKQTDAVRTESHAIGDRVNMAYKGCIVTRGRGEGLCVATGMETEFGKIAALLQKEGDSKTPLQHRLSRFGKRLSIIILAVCALIFAIGLLRGEPVSIMFLTAVSLAVAAIPEALPAIVTISLALGAKRMVKSNALIRRLPAVEALGSVSYICTDKTGTLTQNRMSLEEIYADNTLHQALPADGELWSLIGESLALSNDVELDAKGRLLGDPTEIALYEAASNAGYVKASLLTDLPRIAELPFDSTRQRMTTLHQHNRGLVAFTKGAPEAILDRCHDSLTATGPEPLDKETVQRAAEKLALQGYRVLAIACRRWDSGADRPPDDEMESSLTFLALLALIDPPRPEVPAAVSACRSAGITPIMITGDHPATALAIARRLGIGDDQAEVLSGQAIAGLSDSELRDVITRTSVFARVNPEQKIRLVEALQSQNQFVAMTGDGVNDAPALKQADVGVAMGKIGTEVAREASQLVLLDDNFSTIVTAVREGRRIFDNIRKFIKYTMTSNTGEILTLLLAPFLGMPIPLLPIHILWINLVTDGLPGLALSVEQEERHIMQRPPRPADESIFSHGMWQHMIWAGLLIAALSLFSLAWAEQQGSAHWQTMVFTTLTFAQLAHVLVIRSETDSLFTLGLFSNPFLLITVLLTIVLQLIVIYTPLLQPIFRTQALSPSELGLCALLASIVIVAVEIEKWMVRKEWIYRPAAVKKAAGN